MQHVSPPDVYVDLQEMGFNTSPGLTVCLNRWAQINSWFGIYATVESAERAHSIIHIIWMNFKSICPVFTLKGKGKCRMHTQFKKLIPLLSPD